MGEIEAALEAYPQIREGVVLAREDRPGEKRLVAYLVMQPGQDLTISALRASLQQHLPAYLLPSAFVVLDGLPLTPNGKIDRRALPAPEEYLDKQQNIQEAARTPIEEQLVRLWGNVLGRQRIGIYDNFFEIGGHSLLATQLIYHVRNTFQVNLPLRRIFDGAPTIAQMAEIVEEELMEKLEELSEEEALYLLSSLDTDKN
jgi:acyl carrier protein